MARIIGGGLETVPVVMAGHLRATIEREAELSDRTFSGWVKDSIAYRLGRDRLVNYVRSWQGQAAAGGRSHEVNRLRKLLDLLGEG